MISTLLIANRGEIACRIIRTARRMGIATVAVYSDADAEAPHTAMADRAVRIGGPRADESYLDIEAVIAAGQTAGADAIHPGYGFLSENARFARSCEAAGLVFVGPSTAAIEAMGDKARAKALVRQAGVPVVPGYDGDDQSAERFAREAKAIGYPVLVKAAAGGGGRGMRRVECEEALADALASARREAESAFGDGTLLLEKLIVDARHIEVQIFGDSHGTIVHLGERDCSTQRRHQKIIEEAPSPFVDAPLRQAMTGAAIAAARAVSYVGAGTVEFIVGADGAFHFLEMNTRLQVEHPVTEMVTGIDLAEWQLRVAAGEPIPLAQADIAFRGHAIEARLCAEDPYAGFAPQTGGILFWRPEAGAGDHVRIDHGIREGMAVTPYYDPMVAKVIAGGSTRQDAIARLRKALIRTPLIGVATNRGFLLSLLDDPLFVEAGMTTGIIDARMAAGEIAAPEVEPIDAALAAFVAANPPGADWFSSAGRMRCPVDLQCGERLFRCHVHFERGQFAGVEVDGQPVPLQRPEVDGNRLTFLADGVSQNALAVQQGGTIWLDREGRSLAFVEPNLLAGGASAEDETVVIAPVSGLLRDLRVSAGDRIERGQAVAVIEAMKMETTLAAGVAGRVATVRVRAGDQVRAGDRIIEIDADPSP